LNRPFASLTQGAKAAKNLPEPGAGLKKPAAYGSGKGVGFWNLHKSGSVGQKRQNDIPGGCTQIKGLLGRIVCRAGSFGPATRYDPKTLASFEPLWFSFLEHLVRTKLRVL